MEKTRTENIKNYSKKIYSKFSKTRNLKGKNHQPRCTFNAKYAWLSGAIRSELPEDAKGKVYDFFCPGPRAGRRLIADQIDTDYETTNEPTIEELFAQSDEIMRDMHEKTFKLIWQCAGNQSEEFVVPHKDGWHKIETDLNIWGTTWVLVMGDFVKICLSEPKKKDIKFHKRMIERLNKRIVNGVCVYR